ncbi:MAG TPA: GGDEF domain-containing protein [Pyrinomonadaceae bacterium]|nr:GGDEF domain-containing protein [Pyrinomonadaceae bacterium]
MTLDEAIGQLEDLVAEIRRVSRSDDKTPLGNSLSLAQEEREINQGASAYNVIIFGDLNDFKQLNDSYGYEAGDLAINKVGETIRRIFVEDLQAKAFRLSGDEFVILLTGESAESLSSITPSFSNISFSHKDQELVTAMSFGYARSDSKTSFRELLGRAENACKHAKARGDGACVEWTENIEINPLVRRSGTCQRCGGKISFNVPEQNAQPELKFCPSCGEVL